LIRAVFEAALIVFAVVLGFMVNHWREDVDARQRTHAALVRIAEEMTANRTQLDLVVAYHEEVAVSAAAVATAIENGDAAATGRLYDSFFELMPRGIQPPQLSRVVWEQAMAQDALQRAEFGLIAGIAGVYTIQRDGVETTWPVIADRIFFNTGAYREQVLEPQIRLIAAAFTELAAEERYLVSRYDETLPALRTATDS
tara:strand:- start:971 stop:1567 length:597 start_codon:yes stop_codon:yes gene_type:complete